LNGWGAIGHAVALRAPMRGVGVTGDGHNYD
jgi:hypothetical protein